MITYPLSIPEGRGFVQSRISVDAAIGFTESPFTYQRQTQVNQGQRWRLSLTLPPLKSSQYARWLGWVGALNVAEGTFLCGDTSRCKPFGVATGTPVVDGAVSERSRVLPSRGWTPSTEGILRQGDLFQLGTLANARLYMVTQDANSDADGKVELNIWPEIRIAAQDGQSIITDHPVGLFRLSTSSQSFERDGGRWGFTFEAIEEITPAVALIPIITTPSPFVTDDETPTIEGTYSSETVNVRVYIDGIYDGLASLAGGMWSYTFDDLDFGQYSITVAGVAANGNVSPQSAPLILVVKPEWLVLGPEHQFPLRQSEWVTGQGWYDGAAYETPGDYLTAAGGEFARGSDGTYFDDAGVMQIAGPNVPRLDHDVSSLAALGLRVEGQRVQIIIQTDNFAAAIWVKAGGLTVAPADDGQVVSDPSDTVLSKLDQQQGSNGLRTVQIESKKTNNDKYIAFALIRTNGTGQGVVINTKTGVIHNLTTGVNGGYAYSVGPIRSARVDDFGEFWRLAITGDDYARIHFVPAWNDTGASLFSVSATGEHTLRRPMAEIAEFLSSYIPNSTNSAVARLADSLEYGASQGAGSVTVEARTAIGADGVQTLWRMDDGTDDEVLEIIRDGDREVSAIVTVAGVPEVVMIAGVVADDTDLSVTFSWEAGRYALRINGGALEVNTSYAGPLPAVDTEYEAYPDAAWFGTIARVAYYPEAII